MTAEQASTRSIPTSSRTTIPVPGSRVPPQDIEAEMSLLGSMMLERDCIGEILSIIQRHESERLYRPDHRKLFELLVDMYDRDEPIDLITVRNELDRQELLDDVGGVDYIVQLAESVPSHLHATRYAELIRDKAMLRDLIHAAGRITDEAYDHREEARHILDRAEHLLFQVTDQRISEQVEAIKKYLEEIFEELASRDGDYVTGVRTGFTELDELLCGLQPGEMIIVAARPSMGKTAFGLSVAEYVAATNHLPCAFFSMEMSKRAVVQRILCSRAGVNSHKLRRNMLSESDFGHLHVANGELQGAPLYIDDTPGMSVLELRAKSRRLKARQEIQAIFVDYLQLMHSPGRNESRQQEVAEISRGLKALARELNVPVVVLAQLNRKPEDRGDNRPRMSDLRESGAIEQDADVIILLHREEYYKKMNCPEELKGVAEVIVDKQRNGPTGIVKLQFSAPLARFRNLAPMADGYVPAGDDYAVDHYLPPPAPAASGFGSDGTDEPAPF